MILSNGWPADLEISQYARSLIQRLDDVLVVDSTWATDEFITQVHQYIDEHRPKKIVLMSFVDQHILTPKHFDQPVYTLGYYDSPGFFDFWAHVVVDKFTIPADQELLNHKHIEAPYLSYNRKPHAHRLELYNQLVKHNIIDQGIVSMDTMRNIHPDTQHNDVAGVDGHNIPNDILSLGRTDLWSISFVNIVTETWYDINRAYFVSEKIYKPIVGLRPFFVYATDLGNKWLQDRGFETYENDFRDCYGKTVTADNLVDFLTVLCELCKNHSWMRTKFVALQEKMLYNRQQFYKYVNDNNIDDIIDQIIQ